jgi:signal transduction histidine kinase
MNALGWADRAALRDGLGLVLARRLTEAMGGRLDLDSEVGRGTQVAVLLPLTHGAGTPA